MQIDERNERHRLANTVLKRLNWAVLEPFNPRLVGTLPIDIDIEDSDLDIICEVEDYSSFINAMDHFRRLEAFELDVSDAIVCRFRMDGIQIEIYGHSMKTENQNGYRHMVIEGKILEKFGESFRNEVRHLKTMGLKTEPAFALLLNLYGNPYKTLLEVDVDSIEGWRNPLKDLDLEIDRLVYLDKGWSHDFKLVAETDRGDVLIRITPLETYERKMEEFRQMSILESESVVLPNCLEFKCTDCVIAVFGWVEGFDLEPQLAGLSLEKQYRLGVLAGKGLREIQVPAEDQEWAARYLAKIDRVIKNYRNCGISMENDEMVIDFLLEEKHLIKDRPIVFQP